MTNTVRLTSRTTSLRRAGLLVWAVAFLAGAPGLIAPLFSLPPMERHHFNATSWFFLVPFVAQTLLGLGLLNWVGSLKVSTVALFFGACAVFALNMSLEPDGVSALGALVVLSALAAWAYHDISVEHRILTSGVVGEATVLEVLRPAVNVIVNKLYVVQKLRLEVVRSDDSARYETTASGQFRIGQEAAKGTRLTVLIDSERRERVVIDTQRSQR